LRHVKVRQQMAGMSGGLRSTKSSGR
jgi:hypothetical protein